VLCRWESETQKIEFINPELTPIKVKKEKKGGRGGGGGIRRQLLNLFP